MTTIDTPGGESAPGGIGRRRAEIACISGIAFNTVYSLALLFLSPSLLGTHPVLLEWLQGGTSSLAAGGAFASVGQASPVLVFLAPFPTLLFVTPFYWWAGKLWGPKAAAFLSGGSKRAERWAQRSGGYLERFGGLAVVLAPWIPVPSALIYAAAGWTDMSFRKFMLLDVVGMASWIGLVVGLGYAIGHPAVNVAKAISHYGLEVTVVLVVLVVAYAVIKARGATDAAGPDPSHTAE